MDKINIHTLNKDFENRVRLGIMSVLMVNDWINFNDMKSILNITDGNLASHTNALESKSYITVRKAFVGKKTETSYKITAVGKKAFSDHIAALENLLKQ